MPRSSNPVYEGRPFLSSRRRPRPPQACSSYEQVDAIILQLKLPVRKSGRLPSAIGPAALATHLRVAIRETAGLGGPTASAPPTSPLSPLPTPNPLAPV
ncbi:uncharacterized protein LTHEOB_6378 [Lasiodiplodia theobromae]|uniref:uncharacterized protein n=1 Tax=Lasiodiplodia theobromae TaxID=45133 RepID=UPI0015C3F229|nr:uncharacterized protein LTHEOB_6378 [Lasiodiplodia theobromae]KAF4544260.1 hypothetical protein LTHEOB_6378 [Lasiodiplodia theobromae]